jgi:hypothetical protein
MQRAFAQAPRLAARQTVTGFTHAVRQAAHTAPGPHGITEPEMFNLRFGILMTGIALSGCAGMSEQQCLVSDWRTVGFEDGAAGRPVSSIGTYRESCAEHGVAPDLTAYREGHAEGVEIFCQPGNAFEVGRRGGNYRGVCPAELEPDFQAAFGEGRHLYTLEANLRNTTSRIGQNRKQAEAAKKAMTQKEAALITEGTSAPERVVLLAEMKDLATRQGQLDSELIELERLRAVQQEDLLTYQETLAYGF